MNTVKLKFAMGAYHHGDLRQALIDATDALIAGEGVEAFSLREVARRAGVSPAAPAHHFGDARGLLTAVATAGFEGLTHALEEGNTRGGKDPRARLMHQGIHYVDFALRHPGKFRLMFSEGLEGADEKLMSSGNSAFLVLEDGVRLAFGIAPGTPLGEEAWTALLALWSVVHGYASLAIAGRLQPCAGEKPLGSFVATSLPAVLEKVLEGCSPAKP